MTRRDRQILFALAFSLTVVTVAYVLDRLFR